MDAKDLTINELKNQIEQLQKDFRALKYNYNEEKQCNLELFERLERLRNDKVQIIAQRNDLQDRIQNLQAEVESLTHQQRRFHPIRVQKAWKKLKNRAKCKRKAQYRDTLDNSLKYITECKRAKITLTLGEEDIHFKWTEQQMSDHHHNFNVTLPEQCHSSSEKDSDENLDQNIASNANTKQHELSKYEVFDDDCKFTKRHKRTMITVMDNHRVSHKAYHAM